MSQTAEEIGKPQANQPVVVDDQQTDKPVTHAFLQSRPVHAADPAHANTVDRHSGNQKVRQTVAEW